MTKLIGLPASHALSGQSGIIDATNVHPDGATVVRINDHWFFAADCDVG